MRVHVNAGRTVQAGAIRLSVGLHQGTQLVRRNAGNRLRHLGSHRFAQGSNLVEAPHVLSHTCPVDGILRQQLVQKGEVNRKVGTRANKDVLARRFCGLGTARINHHNPTTPLLNVLHLAPGIRNLQKAPLRHHGIGTHDDQQLGARNIGKRQREGKAEHTLGHGKLVRTVLGRRRVHAP